MLKRRKLRRLFRGVADALVRQSHLTPAELVAACAESTANRAKAAHRAASYVRGARLPSDPGTLSQTPLVRIRSVRAQPRPASLADTPQVRRSGDRAGGPGCQSADPSAYSRNDAFQSPKPL